MGAAVATMPRLAVMRRPVVKSRPAVHVRDPPACLADDRPPSGVIQTFSPGNRRAAAVGVIEGVAARHDRVLGLAIEAQRLGHDAECPGDAR
jgi:hypothetical protein